MSPYRDEDKKSSSLRERLSPSVFLQFSVHGKFISSKNTINPIQLNSTNFDWNRVLTAKRPRAVEKRVSEGKECTRS